ncbi:MAG TPA: methyltransferase domain-containing protein [Gaiellales bacterium]|jgi:ubiquinone/menaquinone biosynthesis C-methylase UbiE|nr:methyltransferase domain-containing protein [Gaiellales bacterium]
MNVLATDTATPPQVDATALVDRALLEQRVREMYRLVATDPGAPRHFETGYSLALRLGYPERLLRSIPAEAVASFAGVGYHLDLAHPFIGDAVLDLGSGSGMDAFCAAIGVGASGRVVGVDFTDAQIQKATFLRARDGFDNVTFVEAGIDELPFEDGSFDVVISNGAINLSPAKHLVFAEAARVLRRGGRIAIADMVSATALEESTRRTTELWAASVAGAIPREAYADALEDAGFRITTIRRNEYRFTSERVRQACRTNGIRSTTFAAVRSARARAADGRRLGPLR